MIPESGTSLLWPGDARAGDLMSDAAVVSAMVAVETAWLAGLVETDVAPAGAACDLGPLVTDADVAPLARAAEDGGTPVLPLVALLRERAGDVPGRWLHRGLTSQDVLDTALVLCLRAVVDRVAGELSDQIAAVAALADRYRSATMAGRSLTQHAVPITFGVKAAGWLQGLLDAADDLAALRLPAQFGGAAGTLAASTELAALTGAVDPVQATRELTARAAAALSLPSAPPWHTARAPVTRAGDALVRCTDAYGRIANDVLVLSRPEIGELREPVAAGRGGSSAMPQKVNPVLSVLIRRAALSTPALAGQLHLAAAEFVDERPDGAWHLEWPALQLLARRTVVAAAQTTELVAGLQVDVDRMRATADAAAADLHAEQRSLAGLVAGARGGPAAYLGAADAVVDAALDRARAPRAAR